MSAVRIVPPSKDGKLHSGLGTQIYTQDGQELKGVTSITVHIQPNEFVTAELAVLAHLEEVWALPFMSEESFLAAARRYGYTVEKVEE